MTPIRLAALVPLILLTVAIAPRDAEAARYVVYLHGRSMTGWPSTAYLNMAASWTKKDVSYDGSARLNNSTVRTAVKQAIAQSCRNGNECVIVCYSAGCARMMLAFEDLRAAGTPANGVLWVSAAGSAAGGSELASVTTNKGLRMLCKMFLTDCASTTSVDVDLTTGSMRGTYGHIQNSAPAPVYHLAGSKNICMRTKLKWSVVGKMTQLGLSIGGPVGGIIAFAIGAFFASKGVKICGNRFFPGDYGDGAVPVHSAAGYANTQAHANHHDGAAKYTFRSYEQIPLFGEDHRSIFKPLVYLGSIRLAVGKNASCPAHPLGSITDADGSIVYEDADGAVTQESSPLYLLQLCGDDVWNGDPVEYGTCYGTAGCCDNFSTGNTGGCSCGETLCIQSKREYRSYFTGTQCDGAEYSEGAAYQTWDGIGLIGMTATTVSVRSARTADGVCRELVHKRTYGTAQMCPEYYQTAKSISGRRVWRKGMDTAHYLVDPNGTLGERNGIVVSSYNFNGNCP
ncbi:MAG TPA: hypothetical protein VIV11_31580 [Kofleriaceae bacterium]